MEHYHGFLVEYLGDYDIENLFIVLGHLDVVFVKNAGLTPLPAGKIVFYKT